MSNSILDDRFFTRPTDGQIFSFPILIVGGSTAAYSATLGALKAGANVCLVQPKQILGGQFTTQALPASDDPQLDKKFNPGEIYEDKVDRDKYAFSKTQWQFRERSRELQPVNGQKIDNPGGGWVSNFATTTVVMAQALNEAIEDFLNNGKLTLIPFAEPVEVLFSESPNERRQVTGVVFQDVQNNQRFTVNAQITIEATDLGDLLELGNIESRVGQESQNDTGEALLPQQPFPECQQSITFCAAVEKTAEGAGVPIGKPEGYGVKPWLQTDKFTSTFQGRTFFERFAIFTYRRIKRLKDGYIPTTSNGDVTILNYESNDYKVGLLTGVSRSDRQKHIQQAREYTQAYIYYLQSQTLKTNNWILIGKVGELKPRGDLTWTNDGIALEPYIREARRGIALTTIVYRDTAQQYYGEQARGRCFDDSVGIGHYALFDIHPTDNPNHLIFNSKDEMKCLPFTIALKAMVPFDTDNLILSAKSIGTTHLTNSVYRMHAVEWAIGEAGGHLAAFALNEGVDVRTIATNKRLIYKFQGLLTRNQIPLFWYNDIAHDDPDFEAIQILAVAGIVRTENYNHLYFLPEGTVNRAVVSVAVVNVMGFEMLNPEFPTFLDVPKEHFAYRAIETMAAKGIVSGVGNGYFAPNLQCTREQLAFIVGKSGDFDVFQLFGTSGTPLDAQPLKRRELSRILYMVLRSQYGID
ncbi:FAD-dependent oxidoreductase [Okeania hirsuta]|uniref:FAD-dependent oxidoreductase n=1 Tax=Okeania hirsuta TaxID=1458930 RepID=UPI000F539B92|nr:FAD-dependent oxidoreductase [Okeania hirsuta]RQH21079.1 FAD-dependent oxidoreductase [Okeania hirsuta]